MEENIIKTKLEELLPNCEVQAWHPTHFISVLTGDTIRPTHAQPGRGQLIRHRAGGSSSRANITGSRKKASHPL